MYAGSLAIVLERMGPGPRWCQVHEGWQDPLGSAWPPAVGLCPVLCVVGSSASDMSEICLLETRSFQSAY